MSRSLLPLRVFVIRCRRFIWCCLFVASIHSAIGTAVAAPAAAEEWTERTPLEFEAVADDLAARDAPHGNQDSLPSPAEALGPIPDLPVFSHQPNTATQLDSAHQFTNSIDTRFGPLLSPDQLLSGGYDGMIDGYAQQLLRGDISSPVRSPNMQTGWYSQMQTLLLNPIERSDADVSRDGSGLAVLGTSNLDIDWSIGVETRLGHRTDDSIVEFGWWALFSASDTAEVISPNSDLVTAIDFNGIGVPFGPAEVHRVESELEIHSVQMRYVRTQPPAGPVQFGFCWGMQFFKLQDQFRFQSDLSPGANLDDIQYQLSVDNRLVGPYLGGLAHWQLAPRLALQCEAQAGIYYNDIDESQLVSNEIGTATFNTGPNAGRPFDFEVTDAVASMLASIDFGVEYEVTNRVRILAGYRFLAAAGIARAAGQVPHQLGPIDRVEIDASDTLLLHGFELGVDFWF